MSGRHIDPAGRGVLVAASVSCFDLCNMGRDLTELTEAGIDLLHFDVVDGRFNDCFILGTPTLLSLRKNTNLPIEVHLGVYEPEKYIRQFIDSGADYVAVHYEALKDAEAGLTLFQTIESSGAKPILALRAETGVDEGVLLLAERVDWIVKLTVDPGYSGQRIKPDAIASIRELHRSMKENGIAARIEADGCINRDTIPLVTEAGATILTGGSSGLFHEGGSIPGNLNELRRIASRQQK
jgi:ribulose-phosphate 3-epimerase